ncbi:MAG: hypothetical protein ACJA08_001237, partial [Cyclobacteriaceae bacterium]
MRYLLMLSLLITSMANLSGQVTISGYVRDAETGEDLIGVTIFDKLTAKGA